MNAAYTTVVELLADMILQYGIPRMRGPMLPPSRRYIDRLIRVDDDRVSDWLLTAEILGARRFKRVA